MIQPFLKKLTSIQLWLLSVVISIALSEVIVSGMDILLWGTVSWDYLLTGLVASFLVSALFITFLTIFFAQKEHLFKLNQKFEEEIIHHKQTEAALRASEERLKLAAASGQVGIWEYNIQTNELVWDDTMFALYGARREDFSGAYDAWSTRLHPEDRTISEAAAQDALAGIRDYAPEFRVIWPDGEVHYIKGHAQVIKDQAGNPVRLVGTNWDNRAYAHTQQQLQLAHTAINQSRSAFYRLSSEGQVADVNDAACQSLGYSREELVGMHVWEFDPNFTPEAWAPMWEGLRQTKVVNIETRHRRKDGTIFPVEVVGNIIYFEGEEYSFTFVQDITERKQVEVDLRIAATTFETHEAIMITDADANILRVNRAFEEITGYSADEVMGKNPRILSSGRHSPTSYAQMWQQLLETGTWSREMWDKHKDGRIYPTWMTITAVKNDKGETTHYVATFTDISERKQVEENLAKSHSLLKTIIDTSPMRVFWKDRNSCYLGCNSLFARDAGFTCQDELIGKTDFEMAWKDQAELYRADDHMVMESGIPKLSYDEPQTTPDGHQIWLRTSKVPLRIENNDEIIGVLGIYEDITERRQAENEKRLAQEEKRLMEQRTHQQLAELSAHLVTSVEQERHKISREIHDDLGGNLTAIKIGLASLARQLDPNQPALLEKTRQLESIVDHTFEFVHRIAIDLRPSVLELGIVAALEWQAQQFEQHLGILCSFTANAEDLALPPEKSIVLFRVCQEALSNIAKHAKANLVTINLTSSARHIKLRITDDGVGIAAGAQRKKNAFGLRGMAERVAAVKGRLSIQPGAENGTEILVKLPR